MARSVSDEELQIRKRARRRLIGAIVLVTVVVVALPMVLDTDPKPVNQDISIRIPSPDAEPFTSKVVPVAPPAAPDKPGQAQARPPAGESKPAPAPAAAAPAKPQPEPAKAAPPAKAPEPAPGKYAVQVIALADAAKAKQIEQKIAAAGVKTYTEVVKTEKGDVTRVRAGPFASAAQAEQARNRLRAIEFEGRKLDGKVVPLKSP